MFCGPLDFEGIQCSPSPGLQAPPFSWLLLVWILHHHACPKFSTLPSLLPPLQDFSAWNIASACPSSTQEPSVVPQGQQPSLSSLLGHSQLPMSSMERVSLPFSPHLGVPWSVHLPLTQPGIQLKGRPVSSINKPHMPASTSLTNISSTQLPIFPFKTNFTSKANTRPSCALEMACTLPFYGSRGEGGAEPGIPRGV